MKKVLFAVIAMIAIGFASCGNKAQAPANGAQDVETAVSEITAALQEQINAQDAGKLQEVLATVQEKVKQPLLHSVLRSECISRTGRCLVNYYCMVPNNVVVPTNPLG